MVRRLVEQAAAAMAGQVIAGDPRTAWSGAALDSRLVRGGELFFALPGARTDGHRFVGQALAAGAAAAVVERSPAGAEAGPLVRVPDTFAGLHALTRAVRSQVSARVVAITGSAGKTTTKELLADMLARRFRVHRSPGNLNNLLGFPVALLGAPDDSEWIVAEMGMSSPGELAGISRLGRPHVAVFTNVRPVHLEFFGSLRAIATAKAELLEGLEPDGRIVANADDPEVRWIVAGRSGVVWYSLLRQAEVWASDLEPLGGGAAGSRFTLHTPAGSYPVELPLLGEHNVENCLAAAACAQALGVDPGQIAAAAAASRPAARRGVVHRLANGARLVDDCYNSNPDALRRSLVAARALPARRRWAVLGDMLELGPQALELHRQAGREAAAQGFDLVLGVGELARELVEAAGAAGIEARWLPSATVAAETAARELEADDLVLVKGSRGVGLEVVVEALLARGGGRC